jgi:hypothetical protein
MHRTGREELDGAMREQQNQQRKQNTAGIETPGKGQSRGEYAHVVEGHRGRDLGEQRAVDQRRCQRQ